VVSRDRQPAPKCVPDFSFPRDDQQRAHWGSRVFPDAARFRCRHVARTFRASFRRTSSYHRSPCARSLIEFYELEMNVNENATSRATRAQMFTRLFLDARTRKLQRALFTALIESSSSASQLISLARNIIGPVMLLHAMTDHDCCTRAQSRSRAHAIKDFLSLPLSLSPLLIVFICRSR